MGVVNEDIQKFVRLVELILPSLSASFFSDVLNTCCWTSSEKAVLVRSHGAACARSL
jgi:hypothetical protein